MAMMCALLLAGFASPASSIDLEEVSLIEDLRSTEGLNLLQVTAGYAPTPVAITAERPVAVGKQSSLAQLERVLSPIFSSLPKNAEGTLDPAGVRYALNRYFAHQHGWRIKNLEPEGLECDAASHAGPLLEIAREIDERGRTLAEVTQLAFRIDGLIHLEALERLRVAYKVERLSTSDFLSDEQAEAVMDTYMASYVIGGNITEIDSSNMIKKATHSKVIDLATQIFSEDYWKRAQSFVRSVRNNAAKEDRSSWSFGELEQLAVEIGDQFGPYRHEEYVALKTTLMSMEAKESKCVPLSNFYSSGMWQFGESADYLKFLGALDVSNTRNPNLIIPNYLNAHSNCLAVSGFYSVCFVNECDDIIGHLEKELLAEDASPEQISNLISAFPSASVNAPRALSPSLLRYLATIAEQHGGRVPLHSRLFAQWLHFAYPRECLYPHLSGSTTTLTVDRYENITGRSPIASQHEMQYYTKASGFLEKQAPTAKGGDVGGTCMPWSTDEELVVEGVHSDGSVAVMLDSTRGILGFAAGVALASVLIRFVVRPQLCGAMSLGINCCSGAADVVDEVDIYREHQCP